MSWGCGGIAATRPSESSKQAGGTSGKATSSHELLSGMNLPPLAEWRAQAWGPDCRGGILVPSPSSCVSMSLSLTWEQAFPRGLLWVHTFKELVQGLSTARPIHTGCCYDDLEKGPPHHLLDLGHIFSWLSFKKTHFPSLSSFPGYFMHHMYQSASEKTWDGIISN